MPGYGKKRRMKIKGKARYRKRHLPQNPKKDARYILTATGGCMIGTVSGRPKFENGD